MGQWVGDGWLWQGVSFRLQPEETVGLVGRNGSGKTTLLDIVGGLSSPDDGSVERRAGLEAAYVRQSSRGGPATAWERLLDGRPQLRDIETRMERAQERMGSLSGEALEEAVGRYGELEERYRRLGGYEHRADIGEVLDGLGLPEDRWYVPTAELSGGERHRVELAGTLLGTPDLLLLDEPTNHLDVDATLWLEERLQQYAGTVLMVSHDRAFLDALCDRIFALEGGVLEAYRGNYSRYLELRDERRRRQREAYEAQQEEIRQLKAFVRRYRAGQKSKQARARQHRLDRMERLEPPPEVPPPPDLTFREAHPTGKEVLRTDGLVIGRGDPLAGPLKVPLQRGERLAVLGPNGSGKTTLLLTLLGDLPPVKGRVEWGTGAACGYFSQTSDLPQRGTALNTVYRHSDRDLPGARGLLGRLGFDEERSRAKIRRLSGGEQSRLRLALLLTEPTHVLLLDEPTNHLDIATRQALERALQDYAGTVVLVSHDRRFVDEVATHMLVLGKGTGTDAAMRRHDPSIWHQGWARLSDDGGADDGDRDAHRKAHSTRSQERPQTLSKNERRRLEERRQRLETRITELEQRQEAVEARLREGGGAETGPEQGGDDGGSDPYSDYQAITDELEDLYRRWEQVVESLTKGA